MENRINKILSKEKTGIGLSIIGNQLTDRRRSSS